MVTFLKDFISKLIHKENNMSTVNFNAGDVHEKWKTILIDHNIDVYIDDSPDYFGSFFNVKTNRGLIKLSFLSKNNKIVFVVGRVAYPLIKSYEDLKDRTDTILKEYPGETLENLFNHLNSQLNEQTPNE